MGMESMEFVNISVYHRNKLNLRGLFKSGRQATYLERNKSLVMENLHYALSIILEPLMMYNTW